LILQHSQRWATVTVIVYTILWLIGCFTVIGSELLEREYHEFRFGSLILGIYLIVAIPLIVYCWWHRSAMRNSIKKFLATENENYQILGVRWFYRPNIFVWDTSPLGFEVSGIVETNPIPGGYGTVVPNCKLQGFTLNPSTKFMNYGLLPHPVFALLRDICEPPFFHIQLSFLQILWQACLEEEYGTS